MGSTGHDSGPDGLPWHALFEQHGIGAYTEKLAGATGATTMDDVRLMCGNELMVDEAAHLMGMPMIPKEKFRRALASLCACDGAGSSPGGAADAKGAETERAQNDTAEDACTIEGVVAPGECVVVCIDRSYSMGSPFNEQASWGDNAAKTIQQRSRMEAVKHVFYAFRDRTDTLAEANGPHHLALLSFDDKVHEHLALTPDLNSFEAIIDDIEKRGSTAIYSAICAAAEMLRPVFERHPGTDLRVVCLTDGENNTGEPPEKALAAVNSIGAVVDAIVVGDCPDENVRRIVAATGGQCYQIRSLTEGFQLMEAEGVVSLRARRGGADKPPFVQREAVEFSEVKVQPITTAAVVKTAQRRVTGKVVALDASKLQAKSDAAPADGSGGSAGGAGGGGGGCTRRVLRELHQMATSPIEGVLVFPEDSDVSRMRALICGPAGTPFEGGVFVLNVFVPANYPFSPPSITFETPIYHCNVSDSGRVCLDILHNQWSPALSIAKALQSIRALMETPAPDDALRQWIAEEVLALQQHGPGTADGRRYLDNAAAHTRTHAAHSVDHWKAKWGVA